MVRIERPPDTSPMTTGTPLAAIRPSTGGPGAVEAGGGLRPAGADDPGRATRQQHPDEERRAHAADQAGRSAVHA